jgi:hypothetical protein
MVSCEIPEEVKVTGSPGVHFPLGKVSEIADEDLAGYLSDERITEMVGGGGTALYRYSKNADVRTYLVHYPITELNLDLTASAQDMDLTEDLVLDALGAVPGTGAYIEIPVPLDDAMGDWINQVRGVTFILNLEMTGSGDVKVQFRRGNTTEPEQVKTFNGGTVKFESSEVPVFRPKTDKITLLVNAPVGTSFKPKLDFAWKSAEVKPGDDGKFQGNYTVSISELTSFLGEGASFKKVSGYLYVGGIPGQSAMTLSAPGVNFKENIPPMSPSLPKPPDNWAPADIPGGYVANRSIDFTAAFRSPKEFPLDYNITMSSAEIQNGGSGLSTIRADMIIELPLEFTVSTASSKAGFVKLSVGLGDVSGNGDWFGREEEGGEDDLFNQIKDAVILVSDIENTILPNATFLLTNNGKELGTIKLTDGNKQAQPLTIGKLTYPFSPQFEILLPIDDQVNKTGTLKVGTKKEVFDFFMVMEAVADINITQTF